MRRVSAVLTVVVALAGSAFFANGVEAAERKRKDMKISEDLVRETCGEDLQVGGGVIGCTKCSTKNCTDYSCNDGSVGGREGCWRTPVQRVAPDGDAGNKPGADPAPPPAVQTR